MSSFCRTILVHLLLSLRNMLLMFCCILIGCVIGLTFFVYAKAFRNCFSWTAPTKLKNHVIAAGISLIFTILISSDSLMSVLIISLPLKVVLVSFRFPSHSSLKSVLLCSDNVAFTASNTFKDSLNDINFWPCWCSSLSSEGLKA